MTSPDIPKPQRGHGWVCKDNELLDIRWMTCSPAPEEMLEFISCKCRKACQLPECECLKNGLPCTEECKLQSCSNMKDNEEIIMDSDEDLEDNDDFIE